MYNNLSVEIKRLGLSQKEFAEKVKISANSFSRKIRSKSAFRYAEVVRIFEYFNPRLSLDYLFEESVLAVD